MSVAQVGLEPTASLVLSQGGLPIAYQADVAVVPDGIEPSFPGCEPSVVAVGPRDQVVREWTHPDLHRDFQRAKLVSSYWTMSPKLAESGETRAKVKSEKTGAFLLAPISPLSALVFPPAEAVGLEPTSDARPPSVFKTGSSSGRVTSVNSSRRNPAAVFLLDAFRTKRLREKD